MGLPFLSKTNLERMCSARGQSARSAGYFILLSVLPQDCDRCGQTYLPTLKNGGGRQGVGSAEPRPYLHRVLRGLKKRLPTYPTPPKMVGEISMMRVMSQNPLTLSARRLSGTENLLDRLDSLLSAAN